MKRTNIYLSDKQLERLRKRAEHEQIPVAELVRRAIDTFLAWDDPTYTPVLLPQNTQRHSHPPHE